MNNVGPDRAAPDRVRVDLGARGYDILAGRGLLAQAGALIGPLIARRRVAIVTDRTVADLHLATLTDSLDAAGIAHDTVVLPPGEGAKTFAGFEELVDSLLAARVERGTTLIALGGGVVGDMTGFAASVIRRGTDFVQAPTTLLAQVDSSVGGKTGINSKHGKNLIGAFHQPRLVLADTATLDTLPRRQFLAGYAEMVKYGLIADAEFFAWLESHGAGLADNEESLRRAVIKSCAAKADFVASDEREMGRRALLNLGHTFGHALEAEDGYTDALLHGEAVAIGMVLAFELSARLGLCPAEDAKRVCRHFDEIGLPTGLGGERLAGRAWQAETLIGHMRQDKKVRDGRVVFVLTRGIGEAFVADDIDLAAVRDLLTHAIG